MSPVPGLYRGILNRQEIPEPPRLTPDSWNVSNSTRDIWPKSCTMSWLYTECPTRKGQYSGRSQYRSFQAKKCMYMCRIPNGSRDRAISLYITLHTNGSQPFWDRGPVSSFLIRRGPGIFYTRARYGLRPDDWETLLYTVHTSHMPYELQSALMLTVEFSKMYYTR
jgi:hypothetical protein